MGFLGTFTVSFYIIFWTYSDKNQLVTNLLNVYHVIRSNGPGLLFNFHHLIIGSVGTIFRVWVSKVIMHTNSRCCLATLSPNITFQSPISFRYALLHTIYSPLAYSFLRSYTSPCDVPLFEICV